MTLDAEGNFYFCENAVLVYDAAGQKAEQISVPARPTNVEFGGSDRKTLFITTDSGSLFSIRMRVQGVAPPAPTPRPDWAARFGPMARCSSPSLAALASRIIVQASTNLVYWTTVCTTNLSNTFSLWTDTDSPNYSRRFYRLSSGP